MGACSSSPPTVTIAITGLAGAGKSHLIKQLLTSPIQAVTQSGNTISVGFANKQEQGPVQHLHAWHYRKGQSQPTSVLTKCSGLIFVVDSTARDSLTCDDTNPQSVKAALHTICMLPELQGKPLLILANKQDAYEAETLSTITDILALKELGMARLWHIHACSTQTQAGVQEGLQWLTRAMSEMESLSSGASSQPDQIDPRLVTISDKIRPTHTQIDKTIRPDSIIVHKSNPTPLKSIPFTPLSRHEEVPLETSAIKLTSQQV